MLKDRVILCGDSKTGKTSIFRYIRGLEFKDFLRTTHIASYYPIDLTDQGFQFKINIWDVGGDPLMRNLAEIYMNNVDIVIIVIDITNHNSYDSLPYWIKLAKEKSPTSLSKIIIVINKIDKRKKKKITDEEIEKIKQTEDTIVTSVSAKTGEGVKELFVTVGQILADFHKLLIQHAQESAARETESNYGDDSNNNNGGGGGCCDIQ